MISHNHKCIFIHIPKCAGSSITSHFIKEALDWRKPNYEVLHGWCPLRKIHLQHATAKQLLDGELISAENWKNYFKFTFVRNPWDRAYSDYLWVMEDRKVQGSFKDYIVGKGAFKELFTNRESMEYRGDHKTLQTNFFDVEGLNKMDFIGHFETLMQDMSIINERLGITTPFTHHNKKNKIRKPHYSHFYNKSSRKLVDCFFGRDIELLEYSFENKKKGIYWLKDLF